MKKPAFFRWGPAAITLALLSGCATQPRTQVQWVDLTGGGRTQAALVQDQSICRMMAQQALLQWEEVHPAPKPSLGCSACGYLGAATELTWQQAVKNYEESTFANCMGANGWQKQTLKIATSALGRPTYQEGRTDDLAIEQAALSKIHQLFPDNAVDIRVACLDQIVLLTGEAPSQAVKSQAMEAIEGIPHVREIYNQITVSPVPAPAALEYDNTVNAAVKLRLSLSEGRDLRNIKVVTSKGVVFLMGVVTHTSADMAEKIAASTKGVQKVTPIFEYAD